MTISELSVKRPVLMTMIYVLIAIIACVFLSRIEISLYPEVDMPVISVMVECEDASPEVIEQQIARVLENQFSSVENLNTMTSQSGSDSCIFVLEFDYGSDLDEAEDAVNEAITRASRSLPDWAETPQVMRMDSIGGSEVMTLSLSGAYDTSTLQQIAEDDIAPLLERIEGVAEADVFGGSEAVYEVQVHSDRLEAYSLTFADLTEALSAKNIQTTGGEITENGIDYQISIDERYTAIDDIADTVIKIENGIPIRVSDVADTVITTDDSARESYYNGSPIISISISSDSDSNETTVAKAVKEELPAIREILPEDVYLEIQRDSTEMISDTMNEVYNSAVQGVLFAALVIFIFLRGIKSTIIISLSMPICILITLMCMAAAGLSVNSMSMAGLILGIGMIVDASIIILENTYSFRLKGEKSAIAAVLGSRDMFNAILGSTLTTICVFLPLLIFKNELEMLGVMFQDLIITVCLSLGCSLFVAVTLVPALCGSILKLNTRTQKPLKNKVLKAIDMSMVYAEDRLRNAYAFLLSYFLDHKKMLIVPLVLLFILSIQSLGNIGLSLTPQMETDDEVSISLTMPAETANSVIRERLFRMQDEIIATVPEDAYESISLEIGSSSSGSIRLELPDITMQEYTASDIENMLRPLLDSEPDETWLFSSGRGIGSSGIDVEIRSSDTAVSKEVSEQVESILKGVEGTANVSSDLEDGAPEISLKLKEDVAESLGITATTVSDALTSALSGTTATELTAFSGTDTYDLDVILSEEDISSINELRSLPIQTSSGSYVRLDTIADLSESTAPVTITREDKTRVTHVTADILDGYSASDVQNAVNEALDQFLILPEEATIVQSGEMSDFTNYGPVLAVIVILALFLVYAVMAAQFESLKDPLIIFATIPLLLIGVVFIHVVYGQDFTLFSFIGIIALIGVVVNNGIVLVDWINRLVRVERMSVKEACISSARSRLRPILMTTLTTIIGLIPMAFFPGEGSEMLQPIALTFVGGITTGAFLTLLLSPTLYLIFNKKRSEKVDSPESLQNQILEYNSRLREGTL